MHSSYAALWRQCGDSERRPAIRFDSASKTASTPSPVLRRRGGCQIGVGFVTAQSTRHMHYIMTCLSGDCVVLVTITVTTNLCTKETLCSPGVGCVRMVVRWVSDGRQMGVG